ncbi:hypothetical protein [Chondromyces crocatus]|uniref:Uncharacterized protein n=1 Tax=Chondromyces crocatus TaxID=52 RepID=A0A0K1EGE2_CHOCO|nr:hypothetical protein [Chondromyces crocatus]AKT39919.1 uncharacterized protein CMC5_040700 [Chondromyces crocatus]
MKFTRKDISELLAEVGGDRDVFGHATTSTFGPGTLTLTTSGPCTFWSGGGVALCSEDGASCATPGDNNPCANPNPTPRC